MGTMTSHCLDQWDLPYSETYVAWGGGGEGRALAVVLVLWRKPEVSKNVESERQT